MDRVLQEQVCMAQIMKTHLLHPQVVMEVVVDQVIQLLVKVLQDKGLMEK
jgi:hypothetical protein